MKKKKECTCKSYSIWQLIGELLFGEQGHTKDCDLIIEKNNEDTPVDNF